MRPPLLRAVAVVLLVCLAEIGQTTVEPATPPAAAATTRAVSHKMFAYYYLWWSKRHWHDKLGPNYPYQQLPHPLPATLDAKGCHPKSRYAGNHLTDVSPSSFYNQDRRAMIERDVRNAAKAGLRGFIANWHGNGKATQTTRKVTYSRRLKMLVSVVHQVNKEGIPFKLWIGYQASDSHKKTTAIAGDLAYLRRVYKGNNAFDHSFTKRIPLVWVGSRDYAASVLDTISRKFRSVFYLIGDESPWSWTAKRGHKLDANQYYWSSQNPYTNPASFDQIKHLAAMVRNAGKNPDGSRKRWFAPVAPGYNSILNGGSTCVPRKDGATLKKLFAGNSRSNPDGWVLISWNEITEATYVVPLRRYGGRYLTVIHNLVG